MSWIDSDAIVSAFIVPSLEEKWGDLPFDKLHPFSKAVRLVIDSASYLADILDRNDEVEIAYEMQEEFSCFLCSLNVLLKIEYSPVGELLSIMPELKEQLLRLKASFTNHYGWGKSRFVARAIDRLIKEICDNPRFDNIYLQKDIYEYFSNFFLKLDPRPLPQPPNDVSFVLMSYYEKALAVADENFEYADSLPSRNAALLEELDARDAAAEKIRGENDSRVMYEMVRIRGKMVKVPRSEWRARFAENVHVMIRSTANFIDAIIKNDTAEIDRNLRPNASPFLTNLHALLKTACLSDVHAPQEMQTLQSCLRRLKVAFVEHYGAANSNDVVNVIAQLIDAIYKKPQYGNKTVFEKLFVCFCRSFKSMNVSKPSESRLHTVLKSLKAIVEDACANSKDGVFLFSREDYVAVVNELWKHQTSSEYAVKQSEAATIAELWYEIRSKLIKYAKSMMPRPVETISALSHRESWQLFPKFTTVNEEPHVLDSTTLKELYVTLKIQETPRKTIKSKRPQPRTDTNASQEAVDTDRLPARHGRFAYTKDFKIVADVEHTEPDYEGIDLYRDIPPAAQTIIKELILNINKKKTEGWCKSKANWHVSFQKGVAKRFKRQQIEIQRRTGGRYYWRIIPNELFDEHYNCKLKPRPATF